MMTKIKEELIQELPVETENVDVQYDDDEEFLKGLKKLRTKKGDIQKIIDNFKEAQFSTKKEPQPKKEQYTYEDSLADDYFDQIEVE